MSISRIEMAKCKEDGQEDQEGVVVEKKACDVRCRSSEVDGCGESEVGAEEKSTVKAAAQPCQATPTRWIVLGL